MCHKSSVFRTGAAAGGKQPTWRMSARRNLSTSAEKISKIPLEKINVRLIFWKTMALVSPNDGLCPAERWPSVVRDSGDSASFVAPFSLFYAASPQVFCGGQDFGGGPVTVDKRKERHASLGAACLSDCRCGHGAYLSTFVVFTLPSLMMFFTMVMPFCGADTLAPPTVKYSWRSSWLALAVASLVLRMPVGMSAD